MNPEDLLNSDAESQPKKNVTSPLETLRTDLKFFNDSIKEVAMEIMAEELSEYPIFIAHQHEVSIGEMILDRHELQSQWTIHASTLEEFIENGIINKKMEPRFKQTYKDPVNYICVFVIVPEGANFVFHPYLKG
ncbi:MAG: hypothetical protein ACOH2A_02340 [Sphingobacteriaceae bacterium]